MGLHLEPHVGIPDDFWQTSEHDRNRIDTNMASQQDTNAEPSPDPPNGRVYDACCGSGGLFVQADQFLKVQADQKLVQSADDPPPKA